MSATSSLSALHYLDYFVGKLVWYGKAVVAATLVAYWTSYLRYSGSNPAWRKAFFFFTITVKTQSNMDFALGLF